MGRERELGGPNPGPANRYNRNDGKQKGGNAGRGGNNSGGRGQRHNKWGNNRNKDDAWGGGAAWGAPVPEAEAPQMNTDPEPIYYDDYSDTYPVDKLTVKVAEALRALRANEVDAMTKPILDKWEVKVKMALKMKTALPEPPNWKAPARAAGGGWGSGGGGLDNTAFLAQASQGKKKGKPAKKNQPMHDDPMQESRIHDIWRTQQSIQEHQQKITSAQERMHNLTATLSGQLRESDQLLKGIAKMLQGTTEETRTEIRTDFAQQLQAQQQQVQQQQQQQQAAQAQQQAAQQAAQQAQVQQMAPQQIYQPLVEQHMQQQQQMPGLAPAAGQTAPGATWGMGAQFAGGMFSGMQKKA